MRFLPFSKDSLFEAFKSVINRDEFENNWKAFSYGREIFINENDFKILGIK